MTRTHFLLQVVAVVAFVVLVSLPQRETVRAVSVWRTNGPLEPKRNESTERIQQVQDEQKKSRVGYGSLSSTPEEQSSSRLRQLSQYSADDPRLLPPPPPEAAALGAKTNALIGRARTTLNTPVPYARMVLRNIITGQIEARATADQEGRFSFLDVRTSGYIVELVGADGTVVATSEMVAMKNGDVQQATVRLAATQNVQALFGTVLGATANDTVTAAIENSVRQTVSATACTSGC
jgi:hypothetical protein